jgi:ubiquinone/menaquinone biosynthesis C-methylase UbiE
MLSFPLIEPIKEYKRQFLVHYSMDELSILLTKTKSLLDKPRKEWPKGSDFDFSYVTTFFEMSKMLKQRTQQLFRVDKISNAYLKIYEILCQFPEIIDKTKSPIYRYFDDASFPGAFIRGTDHYIKNHIPEIKYFDWFASSLYNEEEGVLGDEYNLLYNYPFRWLMDKENNNGNVSNPDNILDFRNKFQHIGLVPLSTSDLGFDVSSDYSKQEIFHLKPNIGQILNAMETTSEGGCQITKQFTFFEPRNKIILYLLTKMYKKVNIIKPITSKPDNSEVYILCIGYDRKNSLKYRELILNSLKHWDNSILEEIKIPDDFNKKLTFIANEIYQRQIEKIKFNIQLFYTLLKQRNRYDKPNFVRLPSDFYNRLRDEVNNWLKDNPMKSIDNGLPITKTSINSRKNFNGILLKESEWNNYGLNKLDFYNNLFNDYDILINFFTYQIKPIFRVDTLYGKTLIYNEENRDIAVLLSNLLIKCGGLLRKVMLLQPPQFKIKTKTGHLIRSLVENSNHSSLIEKLKLVSMQQDIWEKIKKFLSKFKISYEKFDQITRITNNDIDFLNNLKIDYKQVKKSEGRELSRIRDIEKYLKPLKNKNISYLDLGSSEGKITSVVSSYLNLPKNKAYGIDIKPEIEAVNFDPSREEVNFTYLQYNGVDIKFDDNEFDLITIFQALHHFSDLGGTLQSLNRVMKPNGILIVREHDVKEEYTDLFLDFVHAFYMTVNSNEETVEEFANIYSKGNFANYKSLNEWVLILQKFGFELFEKINTRDMFDSGYLIMRKIKDIK